MSADEVVQNLSKDMGGVMTEAYKDLIQPSAQPLGIVFSLLPRTIRLGLRRWERWLVNGEESIRLTAEALKEKVKEIPEEKQCEPEPYVAVPAIQQIAYCYDSVELRNMYANLLASSMNTDKKWQVHPGFVDIIKQITPDEAKLLKVIKQSERDSFPLIDLKLKNSDGGGHIVLRYNFTDIGDDVCNAPENISSYIENLDRLKIISINDSAWLRDDAAYKRLEKHLTIKKIQELKGPIGKATYGIEKKLFVITNFGAQFIRCCID